MKTFFYYIQSAFRFWALLMFGSYSVCNIIVLLNMLIAMMSNSFQVRETYFNNVPLDSIELVVFSLQLFYSSVNLPELKLLSSRT